MAGDEGYPQREVEQEIAPGHGPNDEIYHTYTDEHGNIVKQYDMDAEEITVTPGAHVDWNTVVGQMVAIAHERADAQIPYVHAAIEQFQSNSGTQIAQFIHANTPPADEISWKALVDGLTAGLWMAFAPEAEVGKLIFDTAISLVREGSEDAAHQAAQHVEDAHQQLEAGVRAFTTAAMSNTLSSVDHVKAQIVDQFKHGMQEYQQVTADPTWIDEMVSYFGFPMRTEDTVTTPVLQHLEYEFNNLLTDVQAQLHAQLS
jgi:hypothetical protein